MSVQRALVANSDTVYPNAFDAEKHRIIQILACDAGSRSKRHHFAIIHIHVIWNTFQLFCKYLFAPYNNPAETTLIPPQSPILI